MNLSDLLAALGLFLVLEGIAPFLNPQGVKRAFAANFPRLQKLKDVYDPDNLFRNNQNIPPSTNS